MMPSHISFHFHPFCIPFTLDLDLSASRVESLNRLNPAYFSSVGKINPLWWLNSPLPSYSMSFPWVTKMAAAVPLNLQEEHAKERLDEVREDYRVHEVFPLGKRSVVVDFFLPRRELVIECWRSDSRRGTANRAENSAPGRHRPWADPYWKCATRR